MWESFCDPENYMNNIVSLSFCVLFSYTYKRVLPPPVYYELRINNDPVLVHYMQIHKQLVNTNHLLKLLTNENRPSLKS